MKRVYAVFVMIALFLTGCSKGDSGLEQALTLRQKLQQSSCSFDAEITADYGETLYVFQMNCRFDSAGNMNFTVISPETIQGITGTVDSSGGNLTFDDTVLAFELLTDAQITPVSAPWILMRTLRSGYIQGAAETDTGAKLIIYDTYEEDSLQLDIWLDEAVCPTEAEILWNGKRFLSIKVNNFSCT